MSLSCSSINTVLAQSGRNEPKTDSLRQVIAELPDSVRLEAFKEIILIRYTQGDFEGVEQGLAELLQMAHQIGTDRGMADAYHGLSDMYVKMGRYESVMAYSDTLESFARKANYPIRLSQSFLHKALVNRELGNYAYALQNYHKAAEINGDNGFYLEEALGINNGAMLKLDLDMNLKALSDFKQVSKLSEKVQDSWQRQRLRWLSLYGQAKVHKKTNRFSQAIELYNQIIDQMEQLSERRMRYTLIQSLSRSAQCYVATGDLQRAELYLKKAFRELETFDYEAIESEALNTMADIRLAQSQIPEAKEALELALELALKNSHKEIIQQTSEKLARIYSERQDFEKAHYHGTLASIYQDSLHNDEQLRTFARMDAEFDLKQREQEIINLEKENEIKNLWLAFTLSGLALLLVLSLFLWRISVSRKRQTQKIRDQAKIIEKASIEKDYLIKEVHHRTKNNLAILESLLWTQEGQLTTENARRTLEDSRTRVKVISLMHEMLYQNEDGGDYVEITGYLTDLISYLQTLDFDKHQIDTQFQFTDVRMPSRQAVPFCLLANELITNSLQHAYPRPKIGRIRVDLSMTLDKKIVFTVQDFGVGLPDNEVKKGFGLRLIEGLAKQLDASLDFEQRNGLSVSVSFSSAQTAQWLENLASPITANA